MKKIALMLMMIVGAVFLPTAVFASSQSTNSSTAQQQNNGSSNSVFSQSIKKGLNEIGGENKTDIGQIIKTIITSLLFIIGIVAVIMIIYGGIQYTTSAGDSGKVTNAKNTILYSIVGLIVAILAYALVNFVINAFNK